MRKSRIFKIKKKKKNPLKTINYKKICHVICQQNITKKELKWAED